MNFVIHTNLDEESVVAYGEDPIQLIAYAKEAARVTNDDMFADILAQDPEAVKPAIRECFNVYGNDEFRYEVEIEVADLRWIVHGDYRVIHLD